MAEPSCPQGTITVLVVDDDPMMRLFATETLKQIGLATIEAERGDTAVEMVRASPPDIVLLDVEMPGINGFETCAGIRALPAGREIPIVMMTSLDDMVSVNRSYESGATDFVTKPVNWNILGHRFRYILRASETLRQLRAGEARLERAQRMGNIGNWDMDLDSGRMTCSAQLWRVLGLDANTPLLDLEALLSRVHAEDALAVRATLDDCIHHGAPVRVEHRIIQPNGAVCFVMHQAELSTAEGGGCRLLTGTIQDITERKQAESTIRKLAHFDPLTNLPNRQLLTDRIIQALYFARRHQQRIAVMSIGLDRFKSVNETFGHQEGDRLLRLAAERLASCFRDSDSMGRPSDNPPELARLGSNEFSALLTGLSDVEQVTRVANRIQEAFKDAFNINGNEIFITTSIGMATYPNDGDDVESLLKHANTAMNHVKRNGGNGYHYFTEEMNARAMQRMQMETRLRRAIERDELVLYYQPKVDIGSGDVIGAEALIRWNSAELGMISPLDFIPLAEDTGLIIPIGEWVLHTAARQIAAWQSLGMSDLCVAVNLSSRQFRSGSLQKTIENAVTDAGIEPRLLELEITESLILQETLSILKTLTGLKESGFSLSMDDFGTGYSSLSYLQRFPIDTLKIDRSFIREIPARHDNSAITTTIIAMARSLGLKTVAEGVETVEQLAFLQQRGCDAFQGFLFSKPVPAEDFAALVLDHQRERGAGKVLLSGDGLKD